MALRVFSPARTLLIALSLCCLSFAQLAQPYSGPLTGSAPVAGAPGSPPEAKKYSVSGTVLNSQTGEAIPHAMVEVGPLATLTDSNGAFSVDGVTAGMYGVTAQKPGYFDFRGPHYHFQQVQVGPDTEPVNLQLSPEAVIYGRITDSDGLPVQQFNVQVMRSAVVEGRRDWLPQGGKVTDEDGYYRIAGLQPGTYLVVAGPSQMPSIGAMAKTGQQNSGYGQVSFPAPADGGVATGIHVSAGQKISADMSVDAQPFYSITGTLSAPPGGGAWFNMTPRNNIHVDRGQAFMRGENNTFTIRMIPPGDYILHSGTQFQGKQWEAFVPLHVAGDISGLPIVLEPSVSIPIATRVERTQPDHADATARPAVVTGVVSSARLRTVSFQPPPVQVVLRSIDNPQQQVWANYHAPQQAGDSEKYALENIAPGTYKAEFRATQGDLYVASARYGSTDLLRENLVISHYGGADPIEITLRDDGGKVKVKIAGDTGVNGTFAGMSPRFLVVPDRGAPYSPNSQTFSSAEGYTFGNLRPGSYSILVFDDLEDIEYTNPNALEPYMSKAAHVDLAANQETSVTIELQKVGAR